MKRKYWMVEKQSDGQYKPVKKIVCEVTGEMSDKSKVWTEIETGKQFFCCRICNHYMFIKM